MTHSTGHVALHNSLHDSVHTVRTIPHLSVWQKISAKWVQLCVNMICTIYCVITISTCWIQVSCLLALQVPSTQCTVIWLSAKPVPHIDHSYWPVSMTGSTCSVQLFSC